MGACFGWILGLAIRLGRPTAELRNGNNILLALLVRFSLAVSPVISFIQSICIVNCVVLQDTTTHAATESYTQLNSVGERTGASNRQAPPLKPVAPNGMYDITETG